MKDQLSSLLLICAMLLGNCSTAFVVKNDGTILGPTSLIGEQVVDGMEIRSPNGTVVKMNAYATHNPDRAVTGAVKTWIFWRAFSPLIGATGDSLVKATKDPNVIPKDPNVIPVDPNVIPVDPNVITPVP